MSSLTCKFFVLGVVLCCGPVPFSCSSSSHWRGMRSTEAPEGGTVLVERDSYIDGPNEHRSRCTICREAGESAEANPGR